ncbi:hypothetical protein Tco_0719702, partial [Tanacetum coccineum]
MSSMQEDIQCAGSDTRPPMLDRTDFESWQQRIRLYCLGKDNGENIMKSINEGPFHMGTVSDVIAGGTEGIPKDIYSLINHYTDAKDIWENVKMILEGSELTKDDRESQLYDEFEHFRLIKGEPFKDTMLGSSSTENLIESLSNSLALLTQSYKSHLPQTNNQLRASSNARNKAMVQDGKVVVQDVRGRYNANNQGRPFQRNNARGNGVAGNVGGEQVTNIDDDVDDSSDNDLALNVDYVFEADECNAFDSDVDEGPITQTMFMINLTSEDRIYDEAGTSYDSNTPSE